MKMDYFLKKAKRSKLNVDRVPYMETKILKLSELSRTTSHIYEEDEALKALKHYSKVRSLDLTKSPILNYRLSGLVKLLHISFLNDSKRQSIEFSRSGYDGLVNRLSFKSFGFNKYLTEKEKTQVLQKALDNTLKKGNESKLLVLDEKVRGVVSKTYQMVEPIKVYEAISSWLNSYTTIRTRFVLMEESDDSFQIFLELLTDDNTKAQLAGSKALDYKLVLAYKSSAFGFAAERLSVYLMLSNTLIHLKDLYSRVHRGIEDIEEEVKESMEATLIDLLGIQRSMINKLYRLVLGDPMMALNQASKDLSLAQRTKEILMRQIELCYLENGEVLAADLLKALLASENQDTNLKIMVKSDYLSDKFKTLLKALVQEKGSYGSFSERRI